jgi:hypothetical protein
MFDSALVSLILLFILTFVLELGFIFLVISDRKKAKKPLFHTESEDEPEPVDVVIDNRAGALYHHTETVAIPVA